MLQGNVTHGQDVLLALVGGQQVVHQLLHAALGIAVGEDVEFAGDGPFAVQSGLGAGGHLAHGQALDALVKIAQADVADGILVLGHGLHHGAVGGLHQGGGGDAFLLHDQFLPGFKGTGRGIAGDDHDGGILAAQFLPVAHLAGVDGGQLFQGQVLHGVLGVDHGHDGVHGHGDAHGLHALLFSGGAFLVLDVAGAHGHVALLFAQGLDAVAGTAAGDHQLDVGVGSHEGFGGLLHDGQHGGGAVDDDILGVGGHAQTQGGTGKDQSFGEIHDSAPLKGKKSLLRLDPEAPPFSSGFVTEM